MAVEMANSNRPTLISQPSVSADKTNICLSPPPPLPTLLPPLLAAAAAAAGRCCVKRTIVMGWVRVSSFPWAAAAAAAALTPLNDR